jgi:uncharacterized protein
MSRENVEVVRRGIEALNRGDLDGALENLDPEVEWRMTAEFVEDERHLGREGVRRLYQTFVEMFEDYRFEARELIDADDKVVALIHQRGRGRGSGVEVDYRFAQVYTLRDRKVVLVESYSDEADASEAAGVHRRARG